MEKDEIRAKPTRSIEDLKAFRPTGTSSWYASSDHPSIVKSPPPPPPPPSKKGRIVRFQIGDRYPFKSTSLVSTGCVAAEADRPRIQRFAWQLILALDVTDLGDLALFVKPQDELLFVVVCASELCNTSMLQLKELLLTRTFCKQKFDLAYEMLRNVTTFEVRWL